MASSFPLSEGPLSHRFSPLLLLPPHHPPSPLEAQIQTAQAGAETGAQAQADVASASSPVVVVSDGRLLLVVHAGLLLVVSALRLAVLLRLAVVALLGGRPSAVVVAGSARLLLVGLLRVGWAGVVVVLGVARRRRLVLRGACQYVGNCAAMGDASSGRSLGGRTCFWAMAIGSALVVAEALLWSLARSYQTTSRGAGRVRRGRGEGGDGIIKDAGRWRPSALGFGFLKEGL